jgi:hypothetical protein
MAIARCQNCGKPEGRRQTYVSRAFVPQSWQVAHGNFAAQVAKAATTAIPIVFGVSEDPVNVVFRHAPRAGGNLP